MRYFFLIFLFFSAYAHSQKNPWLGDTLSFVQIVTFHSLGKDGCYYTMRNEGIERIQELKCDTIFNRRKIYIYNNRLIYWYENLSDTVVKLNGSYLHDSKKISFIIRKKKRKIIYKSLKDNSIIFKANLKKKSVSKYLLPYYHLYGGAKEYNLRYISDTAVYIGNNKIECYYFYGKMYAPDVVKTSITEIHSELFFDKYTLLPILVIDREYDVINTEEGNELKKIIATSRIFPIIRNNRFR